MLIGGKCGRFFVNARASSFLKTIVCVLKVDAVLDVPLPIHAKENNGAVQLVLAAKPRGAYAKRQKADVCNPFYYYFYIYTKNIMFILISTQNSQISF